MVAQLGARMNYAVPRILHQSSQLEHLFTDLCAVKGWPQVLRTLPQSWQRGAIARITGRVPKHIPPSRITAFNRFGLTYAQRLRQAKSVTERTQTYLWAGKTFGQLVLQTGLCGQGVYGFNSASLEIFQAAKAQGMTTVVEQIIAPSLSETRLLQTEHDRHPGWEPPLEPDGALQDFAQREMAEWQLADKILCGSTFVKTEIEQVGGPGDRCVVVPYGIELPASVPPKTVHHGPLRVLTVGTVGLRKGTPYILEAAQHLKGKAHFRLVGSLHIQPEAIAQLQNWVELIGPVPRNQIPAHYAWADVFLLPSVCEGSATVIYEALAWGLPIITTPNSGAIARNGIDGYIIPIQDSCAIVQALEQLRTDPRHRFNMGQAALKQSLQGSLAAYGERLLQSLFSHV